MFKAIPAVGRGPFVILLPAKRAIVQVGSKFDVRPVSVVRLSVSRSFLSAQADFKKLNHFLIS